MAQSEKAKELIDLIKKGDKLVQRIEKDVTEAKEIAGLLKKLTNKS